MNINVDYEYIKMYNSVDYYELYDLAKKIIL